MLISRLGNLKGIMIEKLTRFHSINLTLKSLNNSIFR